MAARVWAAAGLTALLAAFPAAAAAQTARAAVVYQRATVRAQVPALGPGWHNGTFTHARSSQGDCLGIAIRLPQAPKDPVLVLLLGIKVLEVDRRTNMDVYNLGLDPPADSDWQVVDLKAVMKADTGCLVKQP